MAPSTKEFNMQICIDRYTLVDDVVIYYVRMRDLNSHEEWTFKTRYSELRNVHDALIESKIKNMYFFVYVDHNFRRKRYLGLPIKVRRILKSAGRSFKNILIKSLALMRLCRVRLSSILWRSPKSKPIETRNLKNSKRRASNIDYPHQLSLIFRRRRSMIFL